LLTLPKPAITAFLLAKELECVLPLVVGSLVLVSRSTKSDATGLFAPRRAWISDAINWDECSLISDVEEPTDEAE
jgi:hypothetical protein